MKKSKLVVIIPCLNEAQSLPFVIKSIPKKIKNIKKVEIVAIDDGSKDNTAQVAKLAGIKHLVVHKRNQGLAKTFNDGLKKALELKADIIVNIDGDNQYDSREIPKLVKPILAGKANMVLGNRQVWQLSHMPFFKKTGNIFGSWLMRRIIDSQIQDASTGFRAFTNQVAQSFSLISSHTYTHETIIQADQKDFKIIEVPVKFKKRQFGRSRLIKGIWPHVKNSATIIIRTVLIYKAFKYLTLLGLSIMSLGLLGALRFLWFYLIGQGSGHIQSLIFSSILISIGFSTIVMGILADLIGINRKMIDRLNKEE
jgi:glycosyltransferase involved in cell wall biosynthesis